MICRVGQRQLLLKGEITENGVHILHISEHRVQVLDLGSMLAGHPPALGHYSVFT